MTANANNDNGNLMWIYQFEQPKQSYKIKGTHRYVLGAFRKYPPDDPKKVLICIGLNPNTGIPGRLEKTVQAINDFAFDNKRKNDEIENLPSWPLDGWIMLNLSPIRCSKASSLPPTLDMMSETDKIAHKRNIKIIKSILEKYPDAVRLAAWGDEITKKDKITKKVKDYLRETFYKFIKEENSKKRKWYCCDLPSDREKTSPKKQEELKNIEAGLTGKGNPRHPWIRVGQSWGKKLDEAVLHEFKIIKYKP